MKKLLLLTFVAALGACDKPSESDCKKAIANIRLLLGTDKLTEDTSQSAAWVRSCVGSAKKSSVKCAMEASTVDQLQRCGLVKQEDLDVLLPPAPTPAPGAGSATGSAATGSGSGSGSASGSAEPAAPATGSGSGSGSASGSESGSASGSESGSGSGSGSAQPPAPPAPTTP